MKAHEDWVDGSWTVDCVCGVDFDDGQEMVNCDECGVWVHTWCSRYVKGDDLFACHKCKIKSNDIATKTLRMEDSSTQGQIERGFRPSTEIPMEERVHVQGVPGGDLDMFQSFSSISSRQLWKSTGYVPKKFRFQYKEFPCWDEEENVGVIGSQDDTCAGVLKENNIAAPVGTKGPNDDKLTNSENLSLKDNISCDFREMETKKRILLCPLRKEMLEDRVAKRVKVADKEKEDDDNNKDFVGKAAQLHQ